MLILTLHNTYWAHSISLLASPVFFQLSLFQIDSLFHVFLTVSSTLTLIPEPLNHDCASIPAPVVSKTCSVIYVTSVLILTKIKHLQYQSPL